MDLLYDALVLLHLLGMAVIIGGLINETARWPAGARLVLYGAAAQVVTGVALVGLASSGVVTEDVDNTKITVKLVVALVVAVLAHLQQRSPRRPVLAGTAVLALANVAIAVFW